MEVLRTLRSRVFLGYTVGFPAAFYLLFTTVFDHTSRSDSAYAMVSMALYGAIVAALPGFGARIALERTRGWTRQLALSPMRPATYLAIKVLAASMLTVPAVLAVMLLGRVVNHVSLSVTTWIGLLVAVWAASLPFVALGIVVGYTFRDEAAQGVSMVLLFGLSIVGGLWMPVKAFPHWLARIAEVTPTYRAGELGWSVLGATHVSGTGLAILGGWTVLFAVLAGWRFRRAS
ncbi:ABC transporter permease [Planosporangium sp. 12N6]|uniref:ABC transporter permease n=1 Tax=Planosporangium spinosum TaxID=3402278 RepID=UPI003CE6CA35